MRLCGGRGSDWAAPLFPQPAVLLAFRAFHKNLFSLFFNLSIFPLLVLK